MKTRQPLEKAVQASVVRLLRSVGARVYVIGRPPRRDSVHKGTGQTAGLCDIETYIPDHTTGGLVLLKIEVKRPGGDPLKKRSAEQVAYGEYCASAGVAYVCGGVDEILNFLQARGLVTETPAYRRRA